MSHKIFIPQPDALGNGLCEKGKVLEQLADEGDSVAQYEMGRQFYVGDHGRPRDLLTAFQ